MGCGSSTPASSTASFEKGNKTEPSENVKNETNEHVENGLRKQNVNTVASKRKEVENKVKKAKITENNNSVAVPKPVAFDVGVNDAQKTKAVPARIMQLDPLTNAPKLTAEMLDEKLKAADEKRAQKLENIRETSRKSTKLRSRILEAQQFEQQRQNEINNEITEKLKSANLNKELKRKEREEKKRIRDERARKAREKAKEMRGETELDLELEKDEYFNEEEDSWSTDDATTRESSGFGERIYSGRESPKKQHRPISSAEQRARMINSATTGDSFDYAFQREPSKYRRTIEHDDFFD